MFLVYCFIIKLLWWVAIVIFTFQFFVTTAFSYLWTIKWARQRINLLLCALEREGVCVCNGKRERERERERESEVVKAAQGQLEKQWDTTFKLTLIHLKHTQRAKWIRIRVGVGGEQESQCVHECVWARVERVREREREIEREKEKERERGRTWISALSVVLRGTKIVGKSIRQKIRNVLIRAKRHRVKISLKIFRNFLKVFFRQNKTMVFKKLSIVWKSKKNWIHPSMLLTSI